jgi:hypothetical protein
MGSLQFELELANQKNQIGALQTVQELMTA